MKSSAILTKLYSNLAVEEIRFPMSSEEVKNSADCSVPPLVRSHSFFCETVKST